MSFIETNLGKKDAVLVKARYDRILLVPFIALGLLIVLGGYLLKKIVPLMLADIVTDSGILLSLISDPQMLKNVMADPGTASGLIENSTVQPSSFTSLGNLIFICFLIFAVVLTVVKIIRATGIELAASGKTLAGRYGNDAMCVPLEKIENFAIHKNLVGKIFKYGTVHIGTPSITMKFPYISEPEKFRNKLFEIQKERIRNLQDQ